MGLLSKALGGAFSDSNKYEIGANYELGHSINASTTLGTGGDRINIIREYTGWAWKAISTRSDYLADEELFVERKVGDKWQRDDNHEFYSVLNAEMSGVEDRNYDMAELLEAHQVSKDLYGESFWYFSKGERSNKPMGVYILNPANMTVLVANDKVTGFVYQADGERVLFDNDEIEYFRVYNPANKWRGLSPLQAAGIFVKSARYVTTYVNNFLENNAIPAGVVVAQGEVSDADWTLFKSEWKNRYSGIDNSGKTGFVRGQKLDFVKTGLSLGEVDFSTMKNASRDDIAAMFSVPKGLWGIFEDINRATAQALREIFAESVTSPELRRIKRKLSKRVRQWYGKGYRINSSNPVPEDRELTLDEDDKLVGRVFTANEIRERRGLKPIAGGDVIYPPKTVSTDPVAPAQPAKSAGKLRVIVKSNKHELTYEMKESFRSKMEDVQLKYETQYLKAVSPVIKAQKEAVIAQISPKKIADAGFDVDEEAKKMVDNTISVFIALAKEQGDIAAQFVGNADSEFEFTKVMEKYIRDSIGKASLGLTDETQVLVSTAIQQGLEEGEGLAKIAKRIDVIYDDLLGIKSPGYRIERIARTEVIRTSNAITETAYKQSGIVSKKEWLAQPGACEFCRSLNGTIVNLDASFVPDGGTVTGKEGGTYTNTYGDVRFPGLHPNDRCGLIPVIDEA